MTDTETTPLLLLAHLLEEHEYTLAYGHANDDRPLEQLLVTADVQDGTLIPLRVLLLDSLLALSEEGAEEIEKACGAFIIHASAVLPFAVPPAFAVDLMQAAFVVNRLLPLCSIGVDAQSGSCYLSAVVAIDSIEHIPESVALDTIGMACHCVKTFGPSLKQIATGKLTFAQFTSELAARDSLPPPVPAPTPA